MEHLHIWLAASFSIVSVFLLMPQSCKLMHSTKTQQGVCAYWCIQKKKFTPLSKNKTRKFTAFLLFVRRSVFTLLQILDANIQQTSTSQPAEPRALGPLCQQVNTEKHAYTRCSIESTIFFFASLFFIRNVNDIVAKAEQRNRVQREKNQCFSKSYQSLKKQSACITTCTAIRVKRMREKRIPLGGMTDFSCEFFNLRRNFFNFRLILEIFKLHFKFQQFYLKKVKIVNFFSKNTDTVFYKK